MPSHAVLAANKQWDTCLQCHDFHGNHRRVTPKVAAGMIDRAAVDAYLTSGPDPYGTVKTAKAKEPAP